MNVAAGSTGMKTKLPTPAEVIAHLRRWHPTARPFYPHLIGIAAVCALGIAVAMGSIMASLPANVTQDRWGLVDWSPYRAGTLRDEMNNLRIWGESPGTKVIPAAVAPVAAQWRFVGTVAAGKTRVAVIELNANKTQRFGVGDVLPSGGRIESVGTGEIVIADDASRHTIKLFDAVAPANQNQAADGMPPVK